MKKYIITISSIILVVAAVLVVKRINEKKANLEHVKIGVAHLGQITDVMKSIKDDATFTTHFPDLKAKQTAHEDHLDYGPKRRVVSPEESRIFFPMLQGASEHLKKEAERIVYAEGISLENKKKLVALLRTTLPLDAEINGKTWMESCLENFEKGRPPFYAEP